MTEAPTSSKLSLEPYLKEFDRLKAEQIQRIGYRDNLVYATLGVIGGVLAFALNKDGSRIGLLILPSACFILGWLHTMNDEKISAVGSYFRDHLRPRVCEIAGDVHSSLLGWELVVRQSPRRNWRKVVQFGANLLTFVVPGLVAAGAYCRLEWPVSKATIAAVVAQLLLLGVLAWEMVGQADISALLKPAASRDDVVPAAAEPAPPDGDQPQPAS